MDLPTREVTPTRKERFEYLIRRLCLEFTRPCTLRQLALDTGIHPNTLSRYLQEGDMPAYRARWFERRYGIAWAPARDLSLEEFTKQNAKANAV